jgi:hypothetical protein
MDNDHEAHLLLLKDLNTFSKRMQFGFLFLNSRQLMAEHNNLVLREDQLAFPISYLHGHPIHLGNHSTHPVQ